MTTNREIAEGIVSVPEILTEQGVKRFLDARLANDSPSKTTCKACGGKGYVYSDPDHRLLNCGDCDGEGRVPCEDDDDAQRERDAEQGIRKAAADLRRELARFDAEGRAR